MMDLESGQCHYMLTTGMALMSEGASINYVVSKYAIIDPPPSPFVVFLQSKFGDPRLEINHYVQKIGGLGLDRIKLKWIIGTHDN